MVGIFFALPLGTQQALRDAALDELKYGATRRANVQRALEIEKSANKWQKILTPFVWSPNLVDIGGGFVK